MLGRVRIGFEARRSVAKRMSSRYKASVAPVYFLIHRALTQASTSRVAPNEVIAPSPFIRRGQLRLVVPLLRLVLNNKNKKSHMSDRVTLPHRPRRASQARRQVTTSGAIPAATPTILSSTRPMDRARHCGAHRRPIVVLIGSPDCHHLTYRTVQSWQPTRAVCKRSTPARR